MNPRVVTLTLIETGFLFLIFCSLELQWIYPVRHDWRPVAGGLAEAFLLSSLFFVSSYYNELYNLRVVRSFSEFCSRLPQALGILYLLFAFFYKLIPTAAWEARPLFSSLLNIVVVVSVLLPIRGIFYFFLKSRKFADRVLILGTSVLAWKIAEEIEAAPHLGYVILGFVEDNHGAGGKGVSPHTPYPMFAPLERLEGIINQLHPDRIIVALAERRGRLPVRALLSARMAGIVVEDGIEVHERFTGKLAIESLAPSFLIFSKDFTKPKLQMAFRRAVSLMIATVGLILTSPLMVLIAVAIKLDSKGSVFFFQDRAGLDGRTFSLVKFRTMHPLEMGAAGAVWRRDESSRVTRVGKWLRKLRLDELPQFVNILLGDMDLVGPRPEMVSNVKTMTEQIPYYSLRMGVRPGLTGWAQVKHGYSVSQEDVTEKMRYDLYYVKHMSPWFDLRIIVDTVKIVLLGRGSEERSRTEKRSYEIASAGEPKIHLAVPKK